MVEMEREFTVVVLEEATKEDMCRSMYMLDTMGSDEWEEMEYCEDVNKKLEKIDEWRRYRAKCGCGYKNRKR